MFGGLFVAKKKLYPQRVKGKIRNVKTILNFIFLSIYAFSPFIRYDRGSGIANHAILIDMPGRKAYFFAIEIWPQELFYFAGY
jgi:Polyferredoxin